ncbi:MAG: peptide deformylase [Gemmatimonadetes bacterium]|nr:peptide deformylase [Gemmatimonadota bacterium]
MATLKIELLGSEVLRTRAAEIEQVDDDLKRLIADMFSTMYRAEGVGLAGPQVGVSRRVIVVDVHDEEVPPFALINPRVVESSAEKEKGEEGCLSIPGLSAAVERPAHVVVEGLDAAGNPVRVEGGGLLGRCLQHEIDHLDGILFIDRVGPLKRKMLMQKWKKQQG